MEKGRKKRKRSEPEGGQAVKCWRTESAPCSTGKPAEEESHGAGDITGSSSSTSKKPGAYKPTEAAWPWEAFKLEAALFKKFENRIVYVDAFNVLPQVVWFLEQSDLPHSGNSFKMVYYDENIHGENINASVFPEFLSPKRVSSTIKNEECLKTALSIFEDMASRLYYLPRQKHWDSTDTARELHIQQLQELAKSNQSIVDKYLNGYLLRAFMKRMTNSAGKNGLRAILEMASMVAFGQEIVNIAPCWQVGSSPDLTERFPVEVVPSAIFHQRSDSGNYKLRSDANSPGPSVSETGDSRASGGRTSVAGSSTTHGGGVYADVLLFCGHEPNWPRFLFVGEVKSGSAPFSDASYSQLVREMLAPIMHQSVVFGLMMNDTGAVLCSMEQDYDEKLIRVYFDHYSFLTGRSFHYEGIKNLFLDIVKALNHGKKNMKEIYHGF